MIRIQVFKVVALVIPGEYLLLLGRGTQLVRKIVVVGGLKDFVIRVAYSSDQFTAT